LAALELDLFFLPFDFAFFPMSNFGRMRRGFRKGFGRVRRGRG
jgi:hypothetical protein